MAKTKDWTVRNNQGERPREFFRGTEDGARAYVEAHFPRPHVEPPSQDPGIPDVKLVSPDGAESTYHAEDGWSDSDENKAKAKADADDDEKEEDE